MNKRPIWRCRRSVRAARTGAHLDSLGDNGLLAWSRHERATATRRPAILGRADQPIHLLVMLAAEEGDALAAARMRVLARLRQVMSAGLSRLFAPTRRCRWCRYAGGRRLLLTLPDMRSVEADRAFEPL